MLSRMYVFPQDFSLSSISKTMRNVDSVFSSLAAPDWQFPNRALFQLSLALFGDSRKSSHECHQVGTHRCTYTQRSRLETRCTPSSAHLIPIGRNSMYSRGLKGDLGCQYSFRPWIVFQNDSGESGDTDSEVNRIWITQLLIRERLVSKDIKIIFKNYLLLFFRLFLKISLCGSFLSLFSAYTIRIGPFSPDSGRCWRHCLGLLHQWSWVRRFSLIIVKKKKYSKTFIKTPIYAFDCSFQKTWFRIRITF